MRLERPKQVGKLRRSRVIVIVIGDYQLSDASFFFRPKAKAGSVAGGLSSKLSRHVRRRRLGKPPHLHSLPHSTRIPVVCSFVAEAEYAGLYAAARIATEERKILDNMGHPQPPYP